MYVSLHMLQKLMLCSHQIVLVFKALPRFIFCWMSVPLIFRLMSKPIRRTKRNSKPNRHSKESPNPIGVPENLQPYRRAPKKTKRNSHIKKQYKTNRHAKKNPKLNRHSQNPKPHRHTRTIRSPIDTPKFTGLGWVEFFCFSILGGPEALFSLEWMKVHSSTIQKIFDGVVASTVEAWDKTKLDDGRVHKAMPGDLYGCMTHPIPYHVKN